MIRTILPLVLWTQLTTIGLAQDAHAASRVITASGEWRLGENKLKRGDSVSAPGPLVDQSSDAGSVLLDCGDESGLLLYRCNTRACSFEPCSTAGSGVTVLRIDLASQLASPSHISKSLFRHEPMEAAVAGVRAPGNPNDAVLLLTSGNVHFGPALNRVLEGQYCLRLTPLPAPQNQRATVIEINWDRNMDPEGSALANGLTPGLYSLVKGSPSNGGCQVEADAIPAWVVMAPDTAFGNLSGQWKSIAPRIAELSKDDVSNDVLMTLRHAALASLADSMAKR